MDAARSVFDQPTRLVAREQRRLGDDAAGRDLDLYDAVTIRVSDDGPRAIARHHHRATGDRNAERLWRLAVLTTSGEQNERQERLHRQGQPPAVNVETESNDSANAPGVPMIGRSNDRDLARARRLIPAGSPHQGFRNLRLEMTWRAGWCPSPRGSVTSGERAQPRRRRRRSARTTRPSGTAAPDGDCPVSQQPPWPGCAPVPASSPPAATSWSPGSV